MAKVTLQSIADRVGVSRMTVSNAFSRPDQLSAALRERILAEAEALGYTGPDPSARSLARGTTGTIGVLWSGRLRYTLSDEVSAGFLGAIADELAPDGLALTLLPAVVDGDVVPVRDVAMDGAIAYSCPPDLPALGWLERRGLPMVYVDMPPRRGRTVITIDDRDGARLAAEHVLGLGHRRIAIVSAGLGTRPGVVPLSLAEALVTKRSQVIDQRLLGWQDALGPAGVAPVLVAQPDVFADARPAVRGLLARRDRPTAVLCMTDVVARDVIAAAHEHGLRVPEDLSVVGFDDNPLGARSHPRLTTVAQDVDLKGRVAARALREALQPGQNGRRAASRRLPVRLVIRESTTTAPREVSA
jgi:DNA-binding LacI/PurR family transcriptional regulator